MKKLIEKTINHLLSYIGVRLSRINKRDKIGNIIDKLHFEFPFKYYGIYPKESLDNKRFYNIGAGNQKSSMPYWSYIDLPSDSYGFDHMDIAYDLESLEPLPLESDKAEVIFNSFLLEHVSWGATKNLIKEAYRTLKKGGVFHCRVHCYEYGVYLLKNNIISRKFFYGREAHAELYKFIEKNYRFIDFRKDVSITSESYSIKASNGEVFTVSALDSFLAYNVTSLSKFALDHPNLKSDISFENSNSELYSQLSQEVDPQFQQKYPHTHNASYINKEMLMEECKKAGFSIVNSVELYQSACPILWEERFHPAHEGFSFGVEAIK